MTGFVVPPIYGDQLSLQSICFLIFYLLKVQYFHKTPEASDYQSAFWSVHECSDLGLRELALDNSFRVVVLILVELYDYDLKVTVSRFFYCSGTLAGQRYYEHVVEAALGDVHARWHVFEVVGG